MPLQMFAAFVTATTILMLIPGPNVALIVATSVRGGTRLGVLSVAGSCAAMAVQLCVVTLGLTEALGMAGRGFAMLRWVGVAYLIWLGVLAWRARDDETQGDPLNPAGPKGVFLRGFLVSLTNPKTLFFYAAFFPQFISPAAAPRQVWLLPATFLLLAATIDTGWALMAARMRLFLTRHGRLRHRLTGAVLMAAGAGLALARRGS